MIKNAVSEEYTSMRRSLTPLLFANVRENLKKIDRVGFYEIAKIHNQDAHGFHEEKCLGIILSQSTLESARKIYDGVLELLGADILIESPAIASYFHPMASGRYMINGEMIAEFGRIHPQVAREYNLGSEACYFECYLDRLQSHTIVQSGLKQGYIEPNKYPNITRELNFIMDERTPTRIAAGLIAAVDPRIHSLELVGTYQGAGIAPGSKSVTYRFVVEDRTKTITDEEALALQNQVIAELAK
jgi:phenylalanyl-tRNA synthetase beta chain